ncbi:hypothetical protein [Burkholderia gladioli]|uniref:hypothetical protein n=1 Tax=Burkholderia gladioli TaxID=28095 RepID=UPI000F7FAF6A|nr:hypothetical protein [Burkholderia gladioli]
MAKAGAATVAAADIEPRNACIAPWLGVPLEAAVATVRGRRPERRRLWKTASSVRALAVALPAAATVAAAVLELRNARIALWTDVPRGATVATVRGRRPARRRHGRTGGGIRALAVTWPAAATVAVAVLERRNARIAPWLGVPRGAAVATVRGRRPARRRLGENRRRCSSAGGDPVGGRDGGGRRARAAQCAHCALAGRSARGGGRDGSRAAARAAMARGKPAAVLVR